MLSFCFLVWPVFKTGTSMEGVVKNHLGLLWEQGETGRQNHGWAYGLT